MNVVIIDYGVGNLRSLRRGLERAGATVTISSDRDVIREAPALVLPGVGAFGECMRNSAPYHDLLVEKADDTPILGVCVGLQLLYDESTEGLDTGHEQPDDPIEGLGLIPGRVERLSGDGDRDGASELKVPHTGWNTLRVELDHPLVEGIDSAASETQRADGTPARGGSVDGEYAYFVHSYCAGVTDRTLASCDYGGPFAAVAANDRGNVVGTQFHPEKSGETGLRLLENFVAFARVYEPERTAAD